MFKPGSARLNSFVSFKSDFFVSPPFPIDAAFLKTRSKTDFQLIQRCSPLNTKYRPILKSFFNQIGTGCVCFPVASIRVSPRPNSPASRKGFLKKRIGEKPLFLSGRMAKPTDLLICQSRLKMQTKTTNVAKYEWLASFKHCLNLKKSVQSLAQIARF